jgi:CMP-N,N'-diacetyllegionaminic acid synthase
MFTAIIPVRKGSRRLKNKNIASFSSSNLLEYKINQLKKVKYITKIVVSSDCDYMLSIAELCGVTAHKRSAEYCDEQTKTFSEVVEHICSEVDGEHVLWATCTSPLVEPNDYFDAIVCYLKQLKLGFDSLMSVEELKRYLWTETGPLNYKLGSGHVPSQELPPLYRVTDGILLAPRAKMIEWKYFHGVKPYKYVMDKRSSVDIDDKLDLECAKAWLDL